MPDRGSDQIKPWFLCLEELGEYIGIRFGRIPEGATQPEWIFLRHAEFDGIGGLADILRQRGAAIDRLPQIKHPARPSWLGMGGLLLKALRPRRRLKWETLTVRKSGWDPVGVPAAVAWQVFDDNSTTAIRRACRLMGVTVNSFLLKHLTKAIRPSLADQSAAVPWMIPVNLRGKIDLENDTVNHSSYVTVKVRPYETAKDVHRHIYDSLQRGDHWTHWNSYQLGRLTSNGLRRRLLTTELAFPQWSIGGFSNLGDWDPDRKIQEPSCRGDWLFAPPVLRCQHLGVGCITFQGRLSLTIQIHPDLSRDSAVAEKWIREWVRQIQMDLGGR